MRAAAIVLAGGSGKRMGADRPKQYLDLCGHPVLYYSLKAFEEGPVESIVLVCGAEDRDFCRREIVEKYGFCKVRAIVSGGKERYHSVYNGLKAIREQGGCDLVLVHDGARPLVDEGIIERTMEGAREKKACIAGMPVKDTIKVTDEQGQVIATPDRRTLWQIQTPQTFSLDLLWEANEKLMAREEELLSEGLNITDDAMIVEHMTGTGVWLTEGSYENLKITTPEDMSLAERILQRRGLGSVRHMENTTLCYLEKNGKYLMLHRVKKKEDMNAGKWIGVGGHLEEGESPEECVDREVYEETGYHLNSRRFRGIITFVYGDVTEYMYLYTSEDFTGEEKVCDEGELAWVDKAAVKDLPLWEGDRWFLRELEQEGPFFSMKLLYDREGTLLEVWKDGQRC